MKFHAVVLAVFCLVTVVFGVEIKMPESPYPWEKKAKQELTDYLEKSVSGEIIIGGEPLRIIELRRIDKTAEETYFVKGKNGILQISGSGRGILYGVYVFIERYLGVHWLAPGVTIVPAQRPLKLGVIDFKGEPALLYRDIFRDNSIKNDLGQFLARNRVNRSGDLEIATEYGGGFDYGAPYHVHTFSLYFPAAKYLKKNPKYFSLWNGKRLGNLYDGQLCLTNPDLGVAILEKLRSYIRKDREKAVARQRMYPRIYSLSINDNVRYCQCENCRMDTEKYGGSGVLFRLLNQIAPTIEKEYPDVFIDTLAYFHTEKIPKARITPHKNIIVRLCDTNTNQMAPFTAPDNISFLNNLKQWSKIASQISLWDYGVSYDEPFLPYPSEFILQENIQTARRYNVKGMFFEHEYADGGDMYDLKIYLEAKLMENPERNAVRLIEFFCKNFYGEVAGKEIFAVRRLLFETFSKKNGYIPWYALMRDFNYIDERVLQVCHAHFDTAEAACKDNEELLKRCRRARLGLDLLTARRNGAAAKLGATGIVRLKKRLANAVENIPTFVHKTDRVKNAVLNALTVLNAAKSIPSNSRFTPDKTMDIPLAEFANLDLNNAVMTADSESESGVVLKINAEGRGKTYHLPMTAGIYDMTKLNESLSGAITKIVENDGRYHWYYIGKGKVTGDSYIYLTRSWRFRGRAITKRETPITARLYLRVKFTGKRFGLPTAGDPGTIWIDRVILKKID